jgi:hypothetical protein
VIKGEPKKKPEVLFTPEMIKDMQEEQNAKAEVYRVKLRKRSPRKVEKEINLDFLFPVEKKLKYKSVKGNFSHNFKIFFLLFGWH